MSREQNRSRRRESSSESSEDRKRHSKTKKRRKRDSSSSPERLPKSNFRNRQKRNSRSPQNKYESKYSGRPNTNEREARRHDDTTSRSHFSSNPKRLSRSPERNIGKPSSKGIDEDERAKKLREMMENANWREEQRAEKVSKHRRKEGDEEKARMHKYDPSFITKELAKAADSGSVEKRIQANRHNIQRGTSSMTENFARR